MRLHVVVGGGDAKTLNPLRSVWAEATILQNPMEEKMDNKMETGSCRGLRSLVFWWLYCLVNMRAFYGVGSRAVEQSLWLHLVGGQGS